MAVVQSCLSSLGTSGGQALGQAAPFGLLPTHWLCLDLFSVFLEWRLGRVCSWSVQCPRLWGAVPKPTLQQQLCACLAPSSLAHSPCQCWWPKKPFPEPQLYGTGSESRCGVGRRGSVCYRRIAAGLVESERGAPSASRLLPKQPARPAARMAAGVMCLLFNCSCPSFYG